ncbi:MAG TPA: sigma-70 family RNA polymerase sigma factor [bacterium]|nr:sigma-70 family RNA polymerase sigma factor [bacterium]
MRTDAELIECAQKGDEQAFTELVDRYQNKVYGTAVRMLGDREEALEAAQEVFLRVWTHLATIRAGTNFGAWLYRITANHAVDLLRRRPALAPVELDEESTQVIEMNFQDRTLTPRQVYAQQELKDRVQRAMQLLSPQQKAVFVLRHYQSLKLSEIADVLNISIGTVKATLHASLERLRVELSEKKSSVLREVR